MRERLEQQTATLPPVYQEWLDALLQGPIPAETSATCEQCAMCDSAGDREGEGIFFDRQVKCCSYVPELPNFLVGFALAAEDESSEKRRSSLRSRIAGRVAVTPLGLGRSTEDDALYDHANRAMGFGRSTLVRCSHYDDSEGGSCSIWPYRNGVCSSWHCKFTRGASGSRFWRALERLISQVERQLALWCLSELDFDAKTVTEMQAGSKAAAHRGTDGCKRYAKTWNGWEGSEEEVYRACAGLVASLSWNDVLEICGPEIRLAAQLLQRAYRTMLDDSLPEVLRPGKMELIQLGEGSCKVATYSSLDPLELPREVLGLLATFDGRTTDEVIEATRESRGIELGRDLLLKLVDFEFLVPDEDGEAAPTRSIRDAAAASATPGPTANLP